MADHEEKTTPTEELERPISEHRKLSEEIINEYDLCLLLGISSNTLGKLRRTRELPYIPLDSRNRIYVIDEVIDWLKKSQRG